ncbi:MAG: serine/threonine-protein kinase [Acidobacteria bacterium]|nr:MAG: serine/threonine-protein kinase [Acidobacteriota bacterium]
MSSEHWKKVRSLTQEAKNKGADDREDYLKAIYQADPSLGLDVISLMEPDETVSSNRLFRSPNSSQQEILTPGDEVGPYRIIGLIGQGGMGRVYQAKDVRLGRFVALKFLPEELERDPHIRARFLQEARMAAALDHPFICKIYEIGEHGYRKFIAMEYVEGETLSDKLGRDRPSLGEIIRLAIEIADALEKAHKSLIHRDLKPQNIMLTSEGHTKLMDFGLARRLLPSPDDTGESWLTASAPGNLLIGTLAYMSPEQFHGEAVDHRSDIFSFGIILYEMLSGTHPFRRATKLETANAISQDKLARFPEPCKIPKELEQIVAKMLQKEPAGRYQSVREIRRDLIDVQNALQSEVTDRAVSPSKWLYVTVVASVVVLVALVLFWSKPFREGSNPLKRVPLTSYPRQERWPSFSPDGKKVVFGWNGGPGNNFDLYVKAVGAEDRTRLTVNSAQEMYPDWSPDGRTIAFARQGARTDRENGLFLVPVGGGPETQLREGDLRDPDWSPDGKYIVLSAVPKPPAVSSRVLLFSLADLKERQISYPPGNQSDTNPVFSPDGRLLAFVRWTGQEAGDIYLLDLRSRQTVRLTSRNRAVSGLAWGPAGKEVIFASNDGREGRIWRVPVSGGEPVATEITAEILSLCFSPAQNLLAYEEGFNELNIWRMPLEADEPLTPYRLIASTQADLNPDYSPDGGKIVFSSRRTGSSEIWTSDAEGQNLVQLTSLGQHSGTPRWSPDGRLIAFDSRPQGHSDILVMEAGGRSSRRLTQNPADDVIPSWSKDGNWIYFGSDRSGKWEVWKVSRDGRETIQVTRNGGWNAAESPDGRFLYYLKAPYSPLYRMPLGGGPETVVINDLVFWPNWKLVSDGIFLAKDHSFFLVEFDGHTRRLLSKIEREPDWEGPQWIALSPDRRWILYSSFDHEVRDIVLVENFR